MLSPGNKFNYMAPPSILPSTFFPLCQNHALAEKINVHVQITNVHIFLVKAKPKEKNQPNKTKQTKIYIQMLSIFFRFFLCAHPHTRAEDEGSRVKGRRITLSDINGNSLNWKPFNGTWISGKR